MGFTKIGGRWVSNDGDQASSPSGVQVENEDEKQVFVDGEDVGVDAHDDVTAGAFDIGPSVGNMGERITLMSPFEKLMVSRMDIFADEQRSLHELCAAGSTPWMQGFKILMSRLKLSKISFLSYNMARIIEVF